MGLYKITVKKLVNDGRIRLEAGMSVEVFTREMYCQLCDSKIQEQIKRQFKMKYNVEVPRLYMSNPFMNVEKL